MNNSDRYHIIAKIAMNSKRNIDLCTHNVYDQISDAEVKYIDNIHFYEVERYAHKEHILLDFIVS